MLRVGPFWMFILGKDLDLHGRHVDVEGVLFSTSNIFISCDTDTHEFTSQQNLKGENAPGCPASTKHQTGRDERS